MAVPEYIRKVERPVNTIVDDNGRNHPITPVLNYPIRHKNRYCFQTEVFSKDQS